MTLSTKIYTLGMVLFSVALNARTTNAAKIEIVEAGRIAKNIRHIHPNLSYDKALQYGRGILRASIRYGIDSNLLVSIAHQESAFRENLPEGKAGELGICQIRKMWVNNPMFQKEFGKIPERELLNPSRNFLFAAWILKDLRESRKDGVIPYWSYYNANKFQHRFKYFKLVNRFLSAITLNKPVEPLRRVATTWDPGKLPKKEFAALPTEPRRSRVIGTQIESKPTTTTVSNNGWIPSALRKLQAQRSKSGQIGYDPAIVKAAFDLNVPSLFGALPVVD